MRTPRNRRRTHCYVLVSAGLLISLTHAVRADTVDWGAKRAALGRDDKLRVLVDKVLSASNGWVMTRQFVAEIADAGFNVVVPRVGCEDMARVKRVADMARDRGIFYMAWMRGTLTATSGTKLVWANGADQDLYSPNADELWDWMTGLILGHARLSVENPAIVGSFLDFENYAKRSQGNCYALSYDDKILREFAAAQGIEMPALEPEQRHPWLEEKDLLDDFRDFQIASWRERCRSLRDQIDAVNPQFQLIVYPRGPLFLEEAIYPEWATERAPLIFADHITYHRPGNAPHSKALAINKQRLEQGIAHGRSKNVPLIYTSGIDPIYEDADPEFCGRNAAMIGDVCDGYWIFYEGPKYDQDHPDYFHWFARANRAIAAGDSAFWQAPRETPDPVMAAQEKLLDQYCGAKVRAYSDDPMPEGAQDAAFTVRTNTTGAVFAVLLEAGEPLRGRLEVRPLGHYTAGCEFTVLAPDRSKLAEGHAEIGQPAPLDVPAKEGGVYAVIVNAFPNPARLFIENQHFCLVPAEKTGLLGAQPRAHFLSTSGAREILLKLTTPSPAETAMMTVFDSEGREVARGDTVKSKDFQARTPVAPEQAGKPWSLQLERAPEGGLEDMALTLGEGCSAFLATHPSRLLVPASE